jgi:hypothetical protein
MQKLLNIQKTLKYKASNPENIKNIKKLLNEIEESNKKIKDINDLNEILNFRKLKEPGYNNYINKEIENIFKELQKEWDPANSALFHSSHTFFDRDLSGVVST